MRTKYMNVGLNLKASKTPDQFSGHGSIFNNIDLGGDIVMPGAFKDTLAEHAKAETIPQMFWMHQMDQVPGVWEEMSEDEDGLFVKGSLLPTTLGKDMQILLGAKAVRGLSIGYMVDDAEMRDDGVYLLHKVTLLEVSLVSLAMNPLAQVESAKARLSSECEYVPRPRDLEKLLRDAGYSKHVAKQVTAKVFSQRDADDSETEMTELAALLGKNVGAMQATVLESILKI